MLDLLIRGATLIDGSGAMAFAGDVGVKGDRIAVVGAVAEPVREVIDGTGRVLAPGFIVMHSHTDYYLLVNPAAESKVSQGVTTEVCGNCGFSPGPLLSDLALERARATLARYDIEPEWRTLGEFLDLLD